MIYPKLNKKWGLVFTGCLFVWGFFILGMQIYVLKYYSQVYNEDTRNPDDPRWSNAYNGMALANAAACILFGLYYIIIFTEKINSAMLLWGIILAVLGCVAAAGSVVLSALEATWLNTAVNMNSYHPCNRTSANTGPTPSQLECTNWLALEVTVAVLSGLAFFEHVFIGGLIFLGMSSGTEPKRADDSPTPVHVPVVRVNNNNNPASKNKANNNNIGKQQENNYGGYDGPYNAFKTPSPQPAKNNRTSGAISEQYDDLHPQYSYHLQQVSLQQQMAQSTNKQQPNSMSYGASSSSMAPVHYEQDNTIQQRGRLQVLHNQRQRAPAPPVPVKPNQSKLYGY